MQNFDYSVIAW